jgi:hypothetical protein
MGVLIVLAPLAWITALAGMVAWLRSNRLF